MKIVPMTTKHVDQVISIENRSFPTPWSKSAFVQEVTSNDFACYIVAESEDEVVGYCGMWIIRDEAHITTLAVHPEHRGRKIACSMLEFLFSDAYRRGARSMTLEVRASNSEAQKLYEKHGFLPRGLRKGYYSDTGEDAIIMWKYNLEPAPADYVNTVTGGEG